MSIVEHELKKQKMWLEELLKKKKADILVGQHLWRGIIPQGGFSVSVSVSVSVSACSYSTALTPYFVKHALEGVLNVFSWLFDFSHHLGSHMLSLGV